MSGMTHQFMEKVSKDMSQSNKKNVARIAGDDDIELLQKLVKRDQFLQVVNMSPPANWVKDHPTAKNVKYIPIERIELLLTRIFQEWRVEILREGQLAQSIFVTVRLHYLDPITHEWRWQDGVGAAPLQTNKDSSAADLANIKSNAVMIGLPAAESYALKDAAEKIGRLFGKDINRRDVAGFTPIYDTHSSKVRIANEKKKIRKKLEDENS